MRTINSKLIPISMLLLILTVACRGDEIQKGTTGAGAEGQSCRADDSCDDGLTCISDLCVRLPDAGNIVADAGDSEDTGGVHHHEDDTGAATDTNSRTDTATDTEADTVTDILENDTSDVASEDPICVIDAPLDGARRPFDQSWTFQATATDPQDGALGAASIRWESDLDGVLGTGATLMTTLNRSGTHLIKCTATDSDGNSGTAQINVVVESPRAEIWHPSDGETRVAGSEIPFIGRGFDAEDGSLDTTSLVWTSSIDGEIGTGKEFRAALSAGANVVTLTATDSDGNNGSTSITLTIE